MTALPEVDVPLRLTEWTSCGGCAAKWGASLLAELVARAAAGACDPRAARRPGAVRRRRGVPRSPTTWRCVDHRLLPAAGRRSGRLRRDRRRQRVQRRVRHGRPGGAGGQRRRLPRALPARGDRRDLRRRGARSSPRPAARWPAGTRSATRSRSSGSPCRASCIPTACSARRAPGPATCWCCRKPLGTGIALAGGTDDDKAAAIAGMRRLNRAASEALQALGDAVHAVTDVTGYGLAGHGWEMAERSGVRVVVDTPGCRCTRARSRPPSAACAPAATRATATTSQRHVDVDGRRRPREALSLRPADLRRAAGRRRSGRGRRARRRRVLAGRRRWRSASRRRSCCADDVARRRASRGPCAAQDGRRRRSVERELWDAGHDVVVGIDEVGRGAWAGPLMVGAAILPARPAGQRRPRLEDADRARAGAAVRPGRRLVRRRGRSARRRQEECDELGMAAAQRLAARRAIEALGVAPDARRRRRQVGLRRRRTCRTSRCG